MILILYRSFAHSATSIVITHQPNAALRRLATHRIDLDANLDEFATPLLYPLPMYLFSFHLAQQCGLDPGSRPYEIDAQRVAYQDEIKPPSPAEQP
jgi:glucosamine 6-phosphate synthetase-like amidotransferase/phosphosugar isomerase protein